MVSIKRTICSLSTKQDLYKNRFQLDKYLSIDHINKNTLILLNEIYDNINKHDNNNRHGLKMN